MSPHVFPPLLLLLLFYSVFESSHSCLQDPTSAYRSTAAVCRLTYPAAVVLNEKTTKVIEAVFQRARYPSVKGERPVLFIGKVTYGLDNLEVHNLTIGQSEFALRAGEGIDMKISNVSAIFRGTIQYGYGSWLLDFGHSLDFEVDTQIDLGINPRLYCGKGKVAADTSDCYLNFHKLDLHLQGDRQPNLLKKFFTDVITLTIKLVVKGQICIQINTVANILADFIQDTAEDLLSDGDISMDIGVTAAPVITANYIESYHKGVTTYKNSSALIRDSVFQPSQLTENRMLYFWLSDQVLNPIIAAAHEDGRFQLNVSAAELHKLFNETLLSQSTEFLRTCLSESPELRVWSSSRPSLNMSSSGTTVWAAASGQLTCGQNESAASLSFQTHLTINVTASYKDKELFLQGKPSEISVVRADLLSTNQTLVDEDQLEFVKEAVEKIGVPKVLAVLEKELTRLLDKQGVNLFDIINPEVIPGDGFVIIQMDFGFPHHLLVQFLQRTFQ